MTRKPALSALLATAVLALYWPALGGGRVFFQRDVFNYWRPHIDWVLASLSAGQTIAWNPGLMFGMPFLADPNFQLFYPPTWLLLVFAPATWFALMVAGHAIFGGLGVARLLTTLGFERGAAAGALAFALSGPIVSIANLWHHYCGASWIAWVLWALHRLHVSEGREWRRFALFSALTALAGSAETVAMIVVLAALTEARRFTGLASLRGLAKAAGVCALIASLQWLPTARALQSSSRNHFTPAQKLAWSLAPSSAPRIVSAGPYGAGVFGDTDANPLVLDDDLPLVASPYLGAFLVPFALWGASLLPAHAAACALFLLGSFGRHLGPVAEALVAFLPFRFPTKLLAGAAVAFALIVGAGVHRAMSGQRRASRPVSFLIALVLAAIMVAQVAGQSRAGLAASLLLGATGALAAARPPGLGIVLAGVFIDLFTGGVWVNRYAGPELARFRPPSVDFVKRLGPSPRIFTVFPGGTWAFTDVRKHTQAPAIAIALAGREGILPPHGLSFGVRHAYGPDFTGLGAAEFKVWEKRRGPAFNKDPGRYLSLGATVAVVSTENTNPLNTTNPAVRFQGVLSTPTRIDIWDRVPRAAFARRARPVASLDAAMDAVAAPDFTPGQDVAVIADAGAFGAGALEGGEATILRDENDVVEIESISRGPGLLVLRDTLREGWTATIGDRPTPILRADVLFRAIRVPPGRSVVRFRYETPGLRLGMALCAAGLLLLAVNRRPEPA